MKLPRSLSGRELLRRLGRLGFTLHHQTGSHLIVDHPSGERIAIPDHPTLKPGTLSGILRVVERLTGLDRQALLERLYD